MLCTECKVTLFHLAVEGNTDTCGYRAGDKRVDRAVNVSKDVQNVSSVFLGHSLVWSRRTKCLLVNKTQSLSNTFCRLYFDDRFMKDPRHLHLQL